mmetsp:Transcript_12582/g.37823  ORF Transcript_12582/g.37823 Transcript_12582/m.37823 type:complete len:231 (-) Transcript_12582:2564-3256(-)
MAWRCQNPQRAKEKREVPAEIRTRRCEGPGRCEPACWSRQPTATAWPEPAPGPPPQGGTAAERHRQGAPPETTSGRRGADPTRRCCCCCRWHCCPPRRRAAPPRPSAAGAPPHPPPEPHMAEAATLGAATTVARTMPLSGPQQVHQPPERLDLLQSHDLSLRLRLWETGPQSRQRRECHCLRPERRQFRRRRRALCRGPRRRSGGCCGGGCCGGGPRCGAASHARYAPPG